MCTLFLAMGPETLPSQTAASRSHRSPRRVATSRKKRTARVSYPSELPPSVLRAALEALGTKSPKPTASAVLDTYIGGGPGTRTHEELWLRYATQVTEAAQRRALARADRSTTELAARMNPS